jgi:phage baseplate assembly protein W
MAKKQFYGIKYPFIAQDEEKYFVDLNKDIKSKIKSLLIHVVFTPKGQRIRDPEFGTNLIKYIYDVNDEETWGNIKNEIKDVVMKYINGITINEVSVLSAEDDRRDVYVRLDYTITRGLQEETDSLITKI